MSFKDPTKALNVINSMLLAEQPRARNRARINEVFNGNPPYTAEETTSNSIHTNVNFLEGTRIIAGARQQFTNAFMKPENYFGVSLDIGPQFKRMAWGNIITKKLNRILKRSAKYTAALESQFAATVLHGIGPVTWLRDRDWCPTARGTEDVLVPTNTLQSLENLSHFAIYTSFTMADLIRMTRADSTGWNMPLVNQVIAYLGKIEQAPVSNTDYMQTYFPEKVEEDFKENSGYWGSDATPVLRCWDFYFLSMKDGKPSWKRRIVVDQHSAAITGISTAGQWLYDAGERCHGKDISQIMHVQFADGCVVPPFRWHSVRSLAYLLYAVCHLQNRLRCRFTDSVFEQMLWMFRATSDGDGERLEKVDLFDKGVIPDGLTWVPQAERHTLDRELLSAAMAMHRQLMAESAAQFQADTNDGTRKEMTATEVMARVNTSNQLMGAMLTRAYNTQIHQYREIARRFCELDHEDCKRFRSACESEGVDPAVWKNLDAWEIIPERVMGSGNKMLEIAQADRLMAIRPLLAPDAQAQVTHMYVEANTDDPRLATLLVPVDSKPVSPAVERATLAWGTLFLGQPVVIASAINRPEYISTLLQMLMSEIQRIEQSGGAPDQRTIMGLANVIAHIEEQTAQIAQDPGQEQNLKLIGDALGQAGNYVKAYIERLQEAQQAGGEQQGMDPKDMAKVQAMLLQAQTKAQIADANAEQKRMQREIQFQADQQRKDLATLAEAQRQGARTQAEIASTDIRTAADIKRQNAVAENTPTEE